VTSIKDRSISSRIARLVGFDSDHAMIREGTRRVRHQADRLQHRIGEHRLVDIELEMPLLPATVIVVLLPKIWQHTMVSASHWVGLTLPGMIRGAGLVFRQRELAEAGAGGAGRQQAEYRWRS